jgi:hypothetical protein
MSDTGCCRSAYVPACKYRIVELDGSIMIAGLGGDVDPPVE